MVAQQTFTKVKPIYLGQNYKSKGNSARVLVYLLVGEKISKGQTTLGLPDWEKRDLVLDCFPCAES